MRGCDSKSRVWLGLSQKRKFLTREGERDEQAKVEGKEVRGVEGSYIA
jgi:hypothetical protein